MAQIPDLRLVWILPFPLPVYRAVDNPALWIQSGALSYRIQMAEHRIRMVSCSPFVLQSVIFVRVIPLPQQITGDP